jgi:AcrR family transcriptional regulator
MIETKERILDAAERLFAERGYAATSLRSIISAAEVNLAAVHYHFRSKEALLEAVLVRRVEPTNQERLDLLARCEQQAGNGRPDLERVLAAFLTPTFRMACDPSRGGIAFLHLVGRLYTESDLLPNIVISHFGPVLMRFAEALARALPDLPRTELYWRSRLAIGATVQALRETAPPESGSNDWEEVLDRLVLYLSAGFRAPIHEPVGLRSKAQEMS